jgi:hypothetical protein
MTSPVVEGVGPAAATAQNRHRLLDADALEGADRRHDLVEEQRRAAPLPIAEIVGREPLLTTRDAKQAGRVSAG